MLKFSIAFLALLLIIRSQYVKNMEVIMKTIEKITLGTVMAGSLLAGGIVLRGTFNEISRADKAAVILDLAVMAGAMTVLRNSRKNKPKTK